MRSGARRMQAACTCMQRRPLGQPPRAPLTPRAAPHPKPRSLSPSPPLPPQPAFIKWAQWMSSRPDLLPPDVCGALERLQSAAPAHSGAHSVAAVEAAFRRPLREVFSAWEYVPVASGSIAQIHRAALAPAAAAACGVAPGTVVAVKVRHPGVDDLMLRDFALMQRAAAAAGRLPGLKALRLDESVRQFGGPLREQLDLSVEASHLERFAHNFRRWRNVVFPRPIYPLVAPGVLVESFEAGDAINGYVSAAGAAAAAHAVGLGGGAGAAAAGAGELAGRRRQERVAEEIAETGLNVYLQMLLKDNFIHADMHPGNILVREVSRPPPLPLPPQLAWTGRLVQGALQRLGAFVAGLPLPASAGGLLRSEPQLVLLDTGMIAELSSQDQKNVVQFFRVCFRARHAPWGCGWLRGEAGAWRRASAGAVGAWPPACPLHCPACLRPPTPPPRSALLTSPGPDAPRRRAAGARHPGHV